MESELLVNIARAFNGYRDADADLTDAKINCAILEREGQSASPQLRDAYAQRDLALQRQITAAARVIELLPPTLQYPCTDDENQTHGQQPITGHSVI